MKNKIISFLNGDYEVGKDLLAWVDREGPQTVRIDFGHSKYVSLYRDGNKLRITGSILW